jgi:hypothetical protein
MKHNAHIKFILITIGILFCQLAMGQHDYLVSVKGDTLRGKVKYLNYATAKSIQITPDGSKKKQVYQLLQVKAFSMAGETYLNIRTNDGYTFMKLVKTGYLSFLAYQLPNQTTWDGRYLQKKDGTGVDVPNIGFKKNISRFLNDCEEVSNSIETRELTKSKLDEIIDEYNECVAKRSQLNNSVQPAADVSTKAVDTWNDLERAIKQSAAFDGKENALEIINDIKLKILRNEKVSNFLINGLKESLASQPELKPVLDAALETLPNK